MMGRATSDKEIWVAREEDQLINIWIIQTWRQSDPLILQIRLYTGRRSAYHSTDRISIRRIIMFMFMFIIMLSYIITADMNM